MKNNFRVQLGCKNITSETHQKGKAND